jgi:alanine dehydrogenase
MHAEINEKRDFLPDFVRNLQNNGFQVYLEKGYGSGIGMSEQAYLDAAPTIQFVSQDEVYQQDYVLVLRYPGDATVKTMRPGSCLISMLHYPTRPNRVEFLKERQVNGISLDSLVDDNGRRLVENLRSVAWNGVTEAFEVLKNIFPAPGLYSSKRPPVQVVLLGAGSVGHHAVQAAIHYGDPALHHQLAQENVPGVMVHVVDYDLTPISDLMIGLLRKADLLIDATYRHNASKPVIPNQWVGEMPQHAVLLDLSVDPYDFQIEPPIVKGIEGIPQGNLDQYVFPPDSEAFNRIPSGVDTTHRRHSVSCYSWPGIRPKECMEVYGNQLRPIMRTLVEAGGIDHISKNGNYFQRAVYRASLHHWDEAG